MNAIVEKIDTARTLSKMFAAENLSFSRPDGWSLLTEHVDVHKYWLARHLNLNISWDDAVFSWYETVMVPIKRVVESWEFRSAFPRQSNGDLYLAVSDHWHYLKERNPDVTPEEAARSFVTHFGHGVARWFSRFLLP